MTGLNLGEPRAAWIVSLGSFLLASLICKVDGSLWATRRVIIHTDLLGTIPLLAVRALYPGKFLRLRQIRTVVILATRKRGEITRHLSSQLRNFPVRVLSLFLCGTLTRPSPIQGVREINLNFQLKMHQVLLSQGK